MLCPWLPDLIRAAKQRGVTTMLVTSGSKLTRPWSRPARRRKIGSGVERRDASRRRPLERGARRPAALEAQPVATRVSLRRATLVMRRRVYRRACDVARRVGACAGAAAGREGPATSFAPVSARASTIARSPPASVCVAEEGDHRPPQGHVKVTPGSGFARNCWILLSGSTGIRTPDQRVKSPQLYRLSYRPGESARTLSHPSGMWCRSFGGGVLTEARCAPTGSGALSRSRPPRYEARPCRRPPEPPTLLPIFSSSPATRGAGSASTGSASRSR